MQNLLSNDLKGKTEISVWHDALNNGICRHVSYNYRPLSVPDPINVLKTPHDKLRALVYCHPDRTPDIFESLHELEGCNSFQEFSIVKYFYSVRKENIPGLQNSLKALHQSSEIQLEVIDYILRKVIFAQLQLEANLNDLINVPEKLEGSRPPLFRFGKPSPLFLFAFALRLHWLVDFSTASPTFSRLRPDIVVRLIHWNVITPLSVCLSDGVQTLLNGWSPKALENFLLT